MEKLLLRPTEAADILGLGKSKTYQLLATGAIPSVRIGKSVRVSAEVLRSWVRDQVLATGQGKGEQHADQAA